MEREGGGWNLDKKEKKKGGIRVIYVRYVLLLIFQLLLQITVHLIACVYITVSHFTDYF